VVASIVAAVDDLFFGAKLRETARGLGVPLVLVPSSQEAAAVVRERRPALLIVDLQSDACRPFETIRAIKADPDLRDTPVLGFFSHVRDDLKAAAAAAGCDEVLPRSAFSARLPEILRRFAPATDAGCAADAPPGARP
jgi:CheY-like chemotaxis protein